MPIVLLFTILAIPASIMGIALGDGFNLLWNTYSSGERTGIGFAFFAGLVIGVISGWVYVQSKFHKEVDHTSGSTEQLVLGTVTTLTALSFCFLYGFAVGPANHGERAWLDGWLVLVLIGFLPFILNINDLVSKMAAKSASAAATSESDDEKVRRIR